MDASNEKMALNLRAKASMQQFLRSKSWVEKVESIERMNAAGKLAREAMRKALLEQREKTTAKALTQTSRRKEPSLAK